MAKKRSKQSSASRASGTAALRVLHDAAVDFEVHEFDAGKDHFGAHAAEALGELQVDPGQVFKTLVVDLTAGRGPKRSLGVACVPVECTLSLKKAAAAFQVPKVSMADPKDASRSSGYVPGGISPLGQKTPLPTVIDHSAQQWDRVYVSGGRRGLDIGLDPAVLVQLTKGSFADVSATS